MSVAVHCFAHNEWLFGLYFPANLLEAFPVSIIICNGKLWLLPETFQKVSPSPFSSSSILNSVKISMFSKALIVVDIVIQKNAL